MTIQEAIVKRHSVRQYLDKPIETDIIDELQAMTHQLNKESGLHIQLVTNDPKAFDSTMAHYGKFTNVRNYFAMIGKDDDTLDERLGYYGEQLVLRAQMLGLNTCWVGLSYKKNPDVITEEKGEKLRCVISLGYGANQGYSHKIKTMEKVTKVEGVMPDWFRKGVESALLAPTAINQQKFLFSLKNERQVQAKAGWGFFSKVDLGIVKYHFEVGAGKENFDWIR